MGSGNLSNSDTSSEEEIDQQPDKVSDDDMDDTTGVGRSYECTFCKRGFTNAQALGGHMNIHRKDKAIAKAKAKSKSKAKQKNHHQYHESSSTLSNKSYTPVSSHDDEQHQYAAATVGACMSYQVYYPASNNPRYLHGYHHYDFMTSPGVPDQSLSLRIGSTPPHKEEDDDDEERLNKSDIDLELRLGH